MVIRRFCPKCGKQIAQGTLCEDCQERKLSYTPPLIQISEYNRTCKNDSWYFFDDIEELVKSRIREALGDKQAEVKLEPFEFIPRKKEKKAIVAHVKTEGEAHTVQATIAYRQCDYGEKKKSNYFEGILQLRNMDERILPFVHQQLDLLSKKGVFVTKTSEQSNGIDIYLTDKNAIQHLARRIQQNYGGEVKISPQLFSHDYLSSKDIYRVNAFVKLPDYTIGSVISYSKPKSLEQKKYLKVTKMGKLVFGYNLETAKQESFKPGLVKEISLQDTVTTSVMAVFPRLTVMNPEDYQEAIVMNAEVLMRTYEPGDEVVVSFTDKGALLVE